MSMRTDCEHCSHARGIHQVPAARTPLDDRAAAGALDEIGEEEQWLWRLVDDADRVIATAPPAPDLRRLSEVEGQWASVRLAEERVQHRIRVTEAALARPGSWLRPAHRAALVRHMRDDRSAAVATAVQRGRIEEVLNRLRVAATTRAGYLKEHQVVLNAGRNARIELERIFDDLIDGYARLNEPPAWFRFGVGFPPPPGAQKEWLAQAREALAQRRRVAMKQPKW
jgi:hypothetical protein